MVTVSVLGPFRVVVDGRAVPLTTGRLRTLLSGLAMSAGRAVSMDQLTRVVWGEEPPADPRRSLQTYAVRLRQALGGHGVEAAPEGLLLRAEPDDVDALRFARLLDAAGRTADPAAEKVLLGEALALWRGDPFDGVASDWLHRTEGPRLLERYLTALERRVDLDIRAGAPEALAAELERLTARHPLRESLWVRLLRVLDRRGRTAEALERYEAVRRRIADELGADPSPELRRLHTELLAGRPARCAAPVVVPRQLPSDIGWFAGRRAALTAVDQQWAARRAGTAPGIAVVTGTPGVGKSTLAIRWAHRVAADFPDGQLYANLRGFEPHGDPARPDQVIRGFLVGLGVSPRDLPSDLDGLRAAYRALTEGKRLLVVLDNASDSAQVRPLLTGSTGGFVVVTSRNSLTGLIVSEGAQPVPLAVLPIEEARELLGNRVDRMAAGAARDAVDEIVRLCSGLPLALAITAARAATHPDAPVEALSAELRDTHSRLDLLDSGDEATSARAVFSWSYAAVGPAAARLFRLLGLHPGPDVSVLAAASLAGRSVRHTHHQLAELTAAHLVTETAPGRYALHDLLAIYAAELAEQYDTETERRDARRRLLDHYLHSGYAAARTLNPNRRTVVRLPLPADGVSVVALEDLHAALDWFAAEHAALMAIVRVAAEHGYGGHAWQLSWTMADYLDRQAYWHDWAPMQRVALAAAERDGDRRGQAHCHRALGVVQLKHRDGVNARSHLERALDLYGELADPTGLALTHGNIAHLAYVEDRWDEVISHLEQSLAHYRSTDRRGGQADALNDLGWSYAQLGDHRKGLRYCTQAVALYQELGDQHWEANAWDSLGSIHQRMMDHTQAVRCYRRALDLSERAGGNVLGTASTLTKLATSYRATGHVERAREAYTQAFQILSTLRHRDAEKVRAELRTLESRVA
ncbi:BTAD domain-containing putative transcriptional regulator [Actinomycetes bacterium KLBMP 9797]